MALTKVQKDEIVKETSSLLSSSKMTVIARYQGTKVKDMQVLRRLAIDNGTTVKVIKNRLFNLALKNTDIFNKTKFDNLDGMLVYAFNERDEAAAAQALKTFMQTNPNLEFFGAFSSDGIFFDKLQTISLASLPSKNDMIGHIVILLKSPLNGVVQGINSKLPSIITALQAKA